MSDIKKHNALYNNGVIVSVEKLEKWKKPVLVVRVEGDDSAYKVASFNSVESANWFLEVMEEFFKGFVSDVNE